MANRPKSIGTAAETAVVRTAHTHGFPHADRLTLTGTNDRGDIRLTRELTGGIILEVKGGDAAKNASDTQIEAWLHETETERRNAGAEHGYLITQRRGVGAPNAHRWWAWARLGWLDGMADEHGDPVIRLLYGDLLHLLDGWGWSSSQPVTSRLGAARGVDVVGGAS